MKERRRMEMELDRISNLPSDVTEKILLCLPIRDAVRTSVLSTKWRYKSAMLPHLVFDPQSISTQLQTFANVVDHLLLSHFGPVYKFKLAREHVSFRDIDRWMLYVSRNSVKEFILEILGRQRYKVPSSMFSCQDLTYLELHRCLLRPPSTFTGFKSLKSLKIVRVTLTDDVLENVIVHCPLLERLTVEWCYDFSQLNINAPNLQVLRFMGDFEDVNILNTSNLVDVFIWLRKFDHRRGPCRSSNLLKLFAQLPNIHRLYMNSKFTKYLAAGSLLEKLPKPCLHLQFLIVRVGIDDVKDIITVICLLRISPALEELEVFAFCRQTYEAEAGKVNSWVDDNQSCSFTQLRHVKIHCSQAVEGALDLIRFLLLSSPALETMTVYKHPSTPLDGYDLAKKLLRFRRASLNLEIILSDLTG
ncbi:F-box/FBD/LRR-repeat protein [Rosa sericea]